MFVNTAHGWTWIKELLETSVLFTKVQYLITIGYGFGVITFMGVIWSQLDYLY